MTKTDSNYPEIQLKKGKETAIMRRHHWIFSGALSKVDPKIKNGDIATISSRSGTYLCTGMYHDASIAFRILSFENETIDQAFWNNRIENAYFLRKQLGLPNEKTNMYRLFHGEGDRIPGLVIDIYANTAVIQLHYPGLEHFIDEIQKALNSLEPSFDKIIVKYTYHDQGKAQETKASDLTTASEEGIKFVINPLKGQKTGFFLDQRLNRVLLGQMSENKRILNLFCYSGGFSIHALKNNASYVTSVDLSQYALDQLQENLIINGCDESRHESIKDDVLKYIQTSPLDYDLIIVDPPAFAKHKSKRHNAIQAYKRLNSTVISKVKKGTLIMTFSCSQVITKDIFRKTIYSAALENARDVKVIQELNQSPDHPVNIFHPETDYLKGLLLFVN